MKTKPEETWTAFLEEIRNNLKSKGVESFLTWKPIKKSMVVTDEIHVSALDYFENQVCKVDQINSIFEFGGGHGRMCRIIQERGFVGKYTIFDFPELHEIQKYYLRSYTNISYENDFSSLLTPKENSLFISMSALEESPKEIIELGFGYAELFGMFLLKFGGGKSNFIEFSEKAGGEWSYDPNFTNSTELLVGGNQ